MGKEKDIDEVITDTVIDWDINKKDNFSALELQEMLSRFYNMGYWAGRKDFLSDCAENNPLKKEKLKMI